MADLVSGSSADLRAKIAVLESENEQLSVRAEETLLLRLVSESISSAENADELLDKVLERLSVLKDIPYCGCFRLNGNALGFIAEYNAFSNYTSTLQAACLGADVLEEIEIGSFVLDGPFTGDTTFEFNTEQFRPTAAAIVPFETADIPNGVFLALESGPSSRLAATLPMIEQVVHTLVERWDKLTLSDALERANEELEARVRDRTRDLDRLNLELRTEIDVRRRAETELTRVTQAVDTSGEAIFMTDRDGVFTYVNPRFTELYGYTPTEVVGKETPRILKSGVYDREFYRGFWELITDGEIFRGELVNRTRGGGTIWVEASASPVLDEERASVGFLAIQRDITARKRIESSLLDIARGVSAKTGETFFRDLVLHLARALDADYAYVTSLNEPGGRRATTRALCSRDRIMANVDYDLDGLPEAEALSTGTCSFPAGVQKQFPRALILADKGIEGFVGSPLRDSSGKLLGVLVALFREPIADEGKARTVLEIFAARTTAELERERAEEDRLQLEVKYRRAQKMEAVGNLAAGVAHDFNNLLSPILGYSEMLTEIGSEEQREMAERIRGAAERGRDLTQQLLAFGRRQVLSIRTVDLGAIVREIESILPRAVREDVVLDIRAGDRPRPLQADPSQIGQVIMNLAVNAGDAMPDGGRITIEVGGVHLEAPTPKHPGVMPGYYVALTVSDTGCGISNEVRERIFEPFFTTKDQGKGSGIGLATVYGIVEQHGGHISLESQLGAGTTFSLLFPQAQGPISAMTDESGGDARQGGHETVLVVEDEPAVRDVACKILENRGYRILATSSPAECVEMIADGGITVDLLLTDVVMPEMNGKQLYEQLCNIQPGLRVLYMSGYAGDVLAHHAVLDEGIDLLTKPFTPRSLVDRVRLVLDRPLPLGETGYKK